MIMRRFSITSSILQALAVVGLLILWVWSWVNPIHIEFARGRVQWELACRTGSLWLDNSPQIVSNAAQSATTLARIKEDYDAQSAPVHDALDRQPYGSDAYRKALDDMRRMRAEMDAQQAAVKSWQAVQPPGIAHQLPLTILIGVFAVGLHVSWFVWLRSRRPARSVKASIGLLLLHSLTAASMTMLFVAAGMWCEVIGSAIDGALLTVRYLRHPTPKLTREVAGLNGKGSPGCNPRKATFSFIRRCSQYRGILWSQPATANRGD